MTDGQTRSQRIFAAKNFVWFLYVCVGGENGRKSSVWTRAANKLVFIVFFIVFLLQTGKKHIISAMCYGALSLSAWDLDL